MTIESGNSKVIKENLIQIKFLGAGAAEPKWECAEEPRNKVLKAEFSFRNTGREEQELLTDNNRGRHTVSRTLLRGSSALENTEGRIRETE